MSVIAMFRQSASEPGAAVQCNTSAPPFIGIKSNGVPLAFQTTHKRNRAGDANKFAGLMAFGRRREGICWVVNKIYSSVSCSRKSPTVPFDMLQLPRCSAGLRQNFSLVTLRPHEPLRGGANCVELPSDGGCNDERSSDKQRAYRPN